MATGAPLASILSLEEDEWEALSQALVEKQQRDSWGNSEELMASLLERLDTLLAFAESGLPVIQVEKSRKMRKPTEVPRPAWLEEAEAEEREAATPALSLKDFASWAKAAGMAR